MSKELYQHDTLFIQRKAEIYKQLEQTGNKCSNPGKFMKKAIEISSKLATMWDLGNFKQRERLQKLVFPTGIIYDRKINAVRTENIHPLFATMITLSEYYRGKKNVINDRNDRLSHLVARAGIEPTTFGL